jgi:hypothetical protein
MILVVGTAFAGSSVASAAPKASTQLWLVQGGTPPCSGHGGRDAGRVVECGQLACRCVDEPIVIDELAPLVTEERLVDGEAVNVVQIVRFHRFE